MDPSEIIAEYGKLAVSRYCEVAGIANENEIPEIFLGGIIACGLHDKLGYFSHVERYYTIIAREKGIELSPKFLTDIGNLRADVAFYSDDKPVGIIELKVFDDGVNPKIIAADLEKMRKLKGASELNAYLGVLVTDATSATWDLRLAQLEAVLGQSCDHRCEPQRSRNGGWSWSFASWKLPTP